MKREPCPTCGGERTVPGAVALFDVDGMTEGEAPRDRCPTCAGAGTVPSDSLSDLESPPTEGGS